MTDSSRCPTNEVGVLRELRKCGSLGCDLPAGHNRGRADVPSNHRLPVSGSSYDLVEALADISHIASEAMKRHRESGR